MIHEGDSPEIVRRLIFDAAGPMTPEQTLVIMDIMPRAPATRLAPTLAEGSNFHFFASSRALTSTPLGRKKP